MTPWELNFEVAFDVNPGNEPDPADWTDLSDRLWGGADIDVGWGDTAARGSLTLLNRDRHLDPTNSSSPYTLDPMRHCRLTVTVDGTPHGLFRGFVKGWTPAWPQYNEARTTVTLLNATSLVATQDDEVDLPRQRTGTRINDLLDQAGWPAARRQIDDGVVWVAETQLETANLLQVMSDTADAEEGELYVDPSGDIVFRDRHNRFDADVAATVAIYGDGDVPAHDLVSAGVATDFSAAEVSNVARVELANGNVYQFDDDMFETPSGSIGRVGKRVLPVRDLSWPPHEATAAAQWLVARFAEPHIWLTQLSVDGRMDEQLPSVLDVGVGDRLRFLHRPPGGGDVEVECCVETVRHRIGNGRWITSWTSEPYFGAGPWAKWDVAGNGWDQGAKWAP